MNLRRVVAPIAVGAGLVAAACGDVNADLEPENPTPPSIGIDGGAMVLSQGGSSPCPVIPPIPRYLADGGVVPDFDVTNDGGAEVPDVCNLFGTCEYGTSADRHCNRAFTCLNNEWTESKSATCYAGICPAAGTLGKDIEGRPCTLDGGGGPEAEAVCNLADGVCACTTGASGVGHERSWSCSAPLIRSCPLARPTIGSKCEGAAYCDYGACKAKRGIAMGCLDEHWQVVPPSCSN